MNITPDQEIMLSNLKNNQVPEKLNHCLFLLGRTNNPCLHAAYSSLFQIDLLVNRQIIYEYWPKAFLYDKIT
jgi:hypothetical protein